MTSKECHMNRLMYNNTYKSFLKFKSDFTLAPYQYKIVLSQNYYSAVEAEPSFNCVIMHSPTHL